MTECSIDGCDRRGTERVYLTLQGARGAHRVCGPCSRAVQLGYRGQSDA